MARPHAAAIVEDAWHRQVDRTLRSRGWHNRVIPHVGYGSVEHIRVFARVLLGRSHDEQPDPTAPDPTYGGLRSPFLRTRGWRAFVTAPAMDVPVTLRVGDRVVHARSDRSGNVDVTMRRHGLEPGWHEVTIEAAHAEPVQAPVVVVAPEVRFGIISDIDDTVISTSLPRAMIAAWNTFVRSEDARHVVPGMSPFYRDLLAQHPGAPIVYVSTGAWNTAPTLTRFLRSHGYPVGPLLLTDWGPTNSGWFRSGQEHKRICLNRLARDFPKIQWLLVGDDGQHDPELYKDFADARPNRVAGICIRQLTAAEHVLSHGIPLSNDDFLGRSIRRVRREVPVFQAPDGYGLMQLVDRAGIVPPPAEPGATLAPTEQVAHA